jgi:hypothetical protein
MLRLFFSLFSLLYLVSPLSARDWYISLNIGKGKEATRENPAKDLGNILSEIEAGDVVHLAQGVYYGKGNNGHYKLEVPVKIYGGYDDAFTRRDPWGETQTILSGVNFDNPNFDFQARLLIELHIKYNSATKTDAKNMVVVDGIIIDNSARNQYQTDQKLKIIRTANPSEKKSQTPNTPGIKITLGKYCDAQILNCVVTNCALESADGALSVSGNKNSNITIKNNLVINNTGNGIFPGSLWKPATKTPNVQEIPHFTLENNTVLFCWKPGPIDEYAGSGIKVDDYTVVSAKNNIFAFNDLYGVENIPKLTFLSLEDNLITGNKRADYKEWNTEMNLAAIEDETETLKVVKGNTGESISIPVKADWATLYLGRKDIKRAESDANIKATHSTGNDLRSMLGLPLQGQDLKETTDVWLHLISLQDAIKAGLVAYKGKYGSAKP